MAGTRARVVCHRCHSKKTRCDLASVSSPNGRCTPCTAAGVPCLFRPSHKGRRRKRTPEAGVSTEENEVSELQVPGLDEAGTDSTGPPESNGSALFSLFSANGNGQRVDAGRSSPSHTSRSERHGDSETIDDISPSIQQSNLEAYLNVFYPWCPVIDPEPNAASQPLLKHAVAMLAGNLSNSLTPHATPRQHYERVKHLFHAAESDSMTRIIAASLVSVSSQGPPNVGNMDNTFWWLGVAIRLAQDIGLHREPRSDVDRKTAGLRRRIWWNLYFRERTGALCQGQPCIIDDDYYDVRLPQVEDFPPSCARQGELFVHRVRLSVIMGQVNKHLFISRRTGIRLPTPDVAGQLTEWLRALPASLRLPISTDRTTGFDRDVHMLHLPYLTTIALVYLNTSTQRLPEACVAAVLAAACTARIFEDYLARGCIRFLSAQGGWYIAIAILALRHVRSMDFLAAQATASINILRTALKHLIPVCHSAKMIDAGLDRLLDSPGSDVPSTQNDYQNNPSPVAGSSGPSSLDDLCAGDGVRWSDFFPFITAQTSPLIGVILTECQTCFPELWPQADPDGFAEILEEFNNTQGKWSPGPFTCNAPELRSANF